MKVLVLGGQGFLGKYVIKELSKAHTVHTFSRSENGVDHIKGSILNLEDLNQAFQNIDIVVNLVGLSPIMKTMGLSYDDVHITGVRNIVEASERNNIKRIIHLSCIGADPESKIDYFRTKGVGEDIIKSSKVKYNILRPSLIDGECNEFSSMLKDFSKLNVLPFPKFKSKIQPIHADFVARTISIATSGRLKQEISELGGKETITIYEFAQQAAKELGITVIPIPATFAKTMLKLVLKTNVSSFSDQLLDFLEMDNVVTRTKA